MRTTDGQTPPRNWGAYATGLIIVLIGLVFLLHNLGYQLDFIGYTNWWALFILVGAVGPLAYAVRRYRSHGRFDGAVLHALLSATSIITVALMFLLNLDWGRWWPLFMILGGLWMLAGNWRRDSGAPAKPE